MTDPAVAGVSLSRLLDRLAARLPASETPRLDAMVLVEFVSGLRRESLLAELRTPVTDVLDAAARVRLERLIDRRAHGVPVAYLVGRREFFGRDFAVSPGVLVPRPETEHAVEAALEVLAAQPTATVHDCCTGSGCLGLSIALERAAAGLDTELVLSDAAPAALEWAQRNVETLVPSRSEARDRADGHVQVALRRLDVSAAPAAGDEGICDVVTANPPYLTAVETSTALSSGWDEPANALDGGEDGLEIYPDLARWAFRQLHPGGSVIVEHGASQAADVRAILLDAGFCEVSAGRDLAGHERITSARRPENGSTPR